MSVSLRTRDDGGLTEESRRSRKFAAGRSRRHEESSGARGETAQRYVLEQKSDILDCLRPMATVAHNACHDAHERTDSRRKVCRLV